MNELRAIAEINEEIKSIVCAAENISLTATNSMLIARQEGVKAVGFTVVSRELRMFSEKMVIAMQKLLGLIYRLVVLIARKGRRNNNLILLSKIGTYNELSQARIAPACARSQADIDEMERHFSILMRELQITIRHTRKQYSTGLVIARSAAIEAAHGGAVTPVLRNIAQSVEDVVDNISVRIKVLESRLGEARL